MNPALVHQKIDVLAEVDVLVVGAGSAGCCAAIAAAQAGARTLLIDRYGFLGGTSTGVLDTFYGFFTPGPQPRKVVGGIPDLVVDQLHARDAMYLRPNTYGAGTGVTYNPEVLKSIWDDLLIQSGAQVLLHTLLIDAELDAAGRIVSVVVAMRQGLRRIRAQRFIDASGDADLCHLAGVPYETAGQIDPAQTLTTTFRMVNVDLDAFSAAGGKKMLAEKMAQADPARHPLPRRKGSFHAMAMPGCASTVAVRVADIDTLDSQDLTRAEMLGRRQAFIFERFVRDCVPGYEKSRLGGLSVQIGVRESRRVYGDYRLTRDDCMSVRPFDDVVLMCGAPIEDHRQGPPPPPPPPRGPGGRRRRN
ncbi:MAG: FAD-dependent oxidoreductase [Phycisphaeraceae bacterium]